jgi:outer membrane protein TolC
VTPPAPVAASWLEWRNKSLKTGDQEYRDWWRVFRDPLLDRLAARAYDQNLSLLSAGTKVLQARAALGIAIGEFFPQQQLAAGAITYNLRSRADSSVVSVGSTASVTIGATFSVSSRRGSSTSGASSAAASNSPMPPIFLRLRPMTMFW